MMTGKEGYDSMIYIPVSWPGELGYEVGNDGIQEGVVDKAGIILAGDRIKYWLNCIWVSPVHANQYRAKIQWFIPGIVPGSVSLS